MDIRCAKISNRADNIMNPESAMGAFKGQKGVCALSCGINMPRAEIQQTPAAITKDIVESFMRRPSLGTEASDAIFKRANDRVLVNQSPQQYPACVSSSAVFCLKNKFVFATAGDNVIFHFVDGTLKEVFTGDSGVDPLYLGHLRYTSPKVSDQITFAKGENTFLICSRKFAEAFTENQLEEELIRATHTTQKGKKAISEVKCDRWIKALWDNLGNAVNSADDYSAVAFTLPAKAKSAKTIVICIIAAVVLAAVVFLTLGIIKRASGERPDGPQPPEPPQQNQDFDFENAERPVGPNGETPSDPPKR